MSGAVSFFQAPGSPCLRHCSFLPEFFTSIPLDAGWTEGKTSLFFLIAGAVWFLVKYLPGRQEWELQGIMPYVTLFLHGAGVYWLLTVSGARIKGGLDESCILDLGKGFFALPFMNFGEVFLVAAHGVKQFRSSDQETKKSRRIKQDRFCSES